MRARGLDQAGLAELAEISQSAVSRHLRAERAPHMDSVKKYAQALGLSVGYLVSGEEAAVGQAAPAPAVGPHGLEMVLRRFAWPDVDLVIVRETIAEVRAEATRPHSLEQPESYWELALRQTLRRRLAASALSSETLADDDAEQSEPEEGEPTPRASRRRARGSGSS
jgi:transcriptional regulator with XRE-family HTH domain